MFVDVSTSKCCTYLLFPNQSVLLSFLNLIRRKYFADTSPLGIFLHSLHLSVCQVLSSALSISVPPSGYSFLRSLNDIVSTAEDLHNIKEDGNMIINGE